MTWRPLLSGTAAARVRQVARSIGDALIASPPPRFAGLAAGRAGRALCLAYLAHEIAALAADRDAAIEGALEGAAATDLSLLAGSLGVAWLIEHLGAGDPSELDALVPAVIDATADPGIVAGLAGIGVYCIERRPDERAVASLGRVVARLAALAVAQPDGALAWRLPGSTGERAEDWPVGVAHGTAGVIAVLASAGRGAAGALLDPAVRWLLAQRIDGGFPACRGGARCTQLAWCNGEIGIAGALLSAACATGSSAWLSEAVAIARHAAAGALDAVGGGLCHGAAGVAHVFGRFWNATGEPGFARAAERWIDRAIERLDPADPTLLTGSAGAALALVAAISEREPAWDRLLALS